MTAPVAAPVSLVGLEWELPCAIEGCCATAAYMVHGEHSVFGCPGSGLVCEFHYGATLAYAKSKHGSIGQCKGCGGQRIESVDAYRAIAL